MERGIYVTGIGSVSAAAESSQGARAAYAMPRSFTTEVPLGDRAHRVYAAAPDIEAALGELCAESPRDAALDRSAQLSLLAAREAIRAAGWRERALPTAVVVASSRGATAALEARHAEFLATGRTRALTSPTTTLGALSSRIAQELAHPSLVEGISATCTGSLQALLLGAAWLRAGLGQACLVGGAEAPLTPFTLAQFRALGLVGRAELHPPCRPLALDPPYELGLGEGACLLALELLTPGEAERRPALAELIGMSAWTERARTATGITPEGDALAVAMGRALDEQRGVDAVVVHAPGTRHGDLAELAALSRVFGTKLPPLCSAKWQTGHTFGAAGALGLDFGVALLSGVRPAQPDYPTRLSAPERAVRSVMINSAGFGGAAASVVLRRVG